MQSFTVIIPEVEEATRHFTRTGSGLSLARSSPLRTSFSYSKQGEHFSFNGTLDAEGNGLGQIEHTSGPHRIIYSGTWAGNIIQAQTLLSDYFTYAGGQVGFQGQIYRALGSNEATSHIEIKIETFRVFLPVAHGGQPYLVTRDGTEYQMDLDGKPSTWFGLTEHFRVRSLQTFVNQEKGDEVIRWEKTIDLYSVRDQWTSLTYPDKKIDVNVTPHKGLPMYILTALHPEIRVLGPRSVKAAA